MKKIAIIHPHVTIKGWAIKTLLYFANFLQEEWKWVEFLTFWKEEQNCFPDLSKNINIYSTQTRWIFRIWWMIKIIWRVRKVELLIIGNSPMHFIAPFVKIINPRVKIIWVVQNIPVYYISIPGLKAKLEKFVLLFIDRIITNSSFIQNKVKEYLKRESEIIYPSIDTDFFQNSWEQKENSQIIFTYSRLVKGKNIELAIKTFKELKSKFSWLKLIIWWSWEEEKNLKNLAKDEENIIFLWNLTPIEIKKNLEKSTIFLFTSLIDAFWLTITEALSMEKWVVALDYWWVWEIIQDWKNWFLTKNDDDFIKKVEILLKDENLRKNFWKEWRKIVIERFSLKSMKNNLLKILEK